MRDERTHRRVLEETVERAQELGLATSAVTVSPAPGPAGNIEFLLLLVRDGAERLPADIAAAIGRALEAAQSLRRSG